MYVVMCSSNCAVLTILMNKTNWILFDWYYIKFNIYTKVIDKNTIYYRTCKR